jgi:hypothetical protein
VWLPHAESSRLGPKQVDDVRRFDIAVPGADQGGFVVLEAQGREATSEFTRVHHVGVCAQATDSVPHRVQAVVVHGPRDGEAAHGVPRGARRFHAALAPPCHEFPQTLARPLDQARVLVVPRLQAHDSGRVRGRPGAQLGTLQQLHMRVAVTGERDGCTEAEDAAADDGDARVGVHARPDPKRGLNPCATC